MLMGDKMVNYFVYFSWVSFRHPHLFQKAAPPLHLPPPLHLMILHLLHHLVQQYLLLFPDLLFFLH